MKKNICLVCCLVAVLLSVTACGEKESNEEPTKGTVKITATVTETQTNEQTTTEAPTTETTTTAPPTTTEAPTTTTAVPTTTTAAPTTTTAVPTTAAPTVPPTTVPVTEALGKFGKADVNFVFKGYSLKLGDTADSMLEKFGQAKSVKATPGCIATDESLDYNYGSFTVTAQKGKVTMIDVKGDVPTAKGIKVGSKVSQVTDAYGNKYDEMSDEEFILIYKTPTGTTLTFNIDGGKVSEIVYG